MKPSKHIAEPTGRLSDDHGHWDYPHDLLVSGKPDPGARQPDTYQAVDLRRRKDGWTAERQRTSVNVIDNAGSAGHAAEAADITPRSAYRLRSHPERVSLSMTDPRTVATASDSAAQRSTARHLCHPRTPTANRAR